MTIKTPKLGTMLVAAALFAGAMTAAHAPARAQDAEEAIKYRKAVMSSIGGHMGALAAIVSGKVPHTGDLKAHADAMRDMSQVAGHIFPEGSDFGVTEAKMAIWENPDKFNEAVEAFQSAAADMAEAAGGDDMAAKGMALKNLGQACKGCHEDFREKKQ